MSQHRPYALTGPLSSLRRPAEEESLFARDVGGRLIRVDQASINDFEKDVHLTIDGHAITVKRAVPLVDSHGIIQRTPDGRPVPRYTTIYDAATLALPHNHSGQHPIPTLCHRDHLPPVGVCRACMVEACEGTRRGFRRQLVPACVQHVSDGMQVHTLDSTADPAAAERVRTAVSVITELLLSDHASVPGDSTGHEGNELLQLATRLGIEGSRFGRNCTQRGQDFSSYVIQVNHDQCIMCMRCERGCNWVKQNHVIGTTGKGYEARISFDLDQAMGSSNCVSCGECAASCPTDALSFTSEFLTQRLVQTEQQLDVMNTTGSFIGPSKLIEHELFRGLPLKLLQLHAPGVWQRRLAAGEVLCHEGEPGGTAFLLCSGKFEVSINSTAHVDSSSLASRRSWLQWFRQIGGGRKGRSSEPALTRAPLAKLADWDGRELPAGQTITLDASDVIYGEASCMNGLPRSATVTAKEDCVVLEIRRNVLELLLRHHASRPILEKIYRVRALDQLIKLPILAELEPLARQRAAAWLRERVDFVQVDANETILEQGDKADYVYIIRIGFVKVAQRDGLLERVTSYLGPGKHFGELAILPQLSDQLVLDSLGQPGLYTSTCTALDHVELFRLHARDFVHLLTEFPELVPGILTKAQALLDQEQVSRNRMTSPVDDEFLKLGLYGAQNLLVLDLERCTRCDECVKACADTHGGVSRLVRDGPRFDRFLIASACRSCIDPFCLAGCPVDAIHRDGNGQHIRIEDYCIGCGLCAKNCPYGCINMHGFEKQEVDVNTGEIRLATQDVNGMSLPIIQQRATTCDMCASIDGRPSCVYACPHNAAFRVDSQGLEKLIKS